MRWGWDALWLAALIAAALTIAIARLTGTRLPGSGEKTV
jgi:hypothetical protein